MGIRTVSAIPPGRITLRHLSSPWSSAQIRLSTITESTNLSQRRTLQSFSLLHKADGAHHGRLHMPLSTDVEISVNIRPTFPQRCVVCSGEQPDSTVGVGDLMIGWFSFFTDLPEGWRQVNVPVHTDCRRPFKLRRWLSRLAYLAIAILIWSYFGEQIEAWLPEMIRRPGRKVVLVGLMAPFIIVELFFPPRFDITATKYYVTFEFADPRYAAAFALENRELRRYEEIKSTLSSETDD